MYCCQIIWSFLGSSSWTGVSALTSPRTLSRGQLKSKGRRKLSKHFTTDQDTVDTSYRIILSVNQLSVYGAVAAICEEFEDHQDRTGQPVILVGQSIGVVIRIHPNNTVTIMHNSFPLSQFVFRLRVVVCT